MLMFWGESGFVWLLVGVTGKISKNLHIFVNFFLGCDPVQVYVVIACFGSLFLILVVCCIL